VLSTVPTSPYRNVQMYDIDGFNATAADVTALHTAGKKVVCYLSAGSYENWRSDAGQFPSAILGRNLDGWPGERWLDVRDVQLPGSVLAHHQRGMSAVLKNDLDQVGTLLPYFDMALNEECNAANFNGVNFSIDLDDSKFQPCR
jgi:hypothetical protein